MGRGAQGGGRGGCTLKSRLGLAAGIAGRALWILAEGAAGARAASSPLWPPGPGLSVPRGLPSPNDVAARGGAAADLHRTLLSEQMFFGQILLFSCEKHTSILLYVFWC